MARRNADREDEVIRGTGNVFADLGYPVRPSARRNSGWRTRSTRSSKNASYRRLKRRMSCG